MFGQIISKLRAPIIQAGTTLNLCFFFFLFGNLAKGPGLIESPHSHGKTPAQVGKENAQIEKKPTKVKKKLIHTDTGGLPTQDLKVVKLLYVARLL